MLQQLTNFQPPQMYEYGYSIVQYKNAYTGEIYNLGIIVEDETGKINYKTIDNVSELSKCIEIGNPSGVEFGLQILEQRLQNKRLKSHQISNSLFVSKKQHYYHESKDINEVSQEIFNTVISLKKLFGKKERNTNQYDRNNIFSKLKDKIKEKKYKNVKTNVDIGLSKNIDVAIYNQKHLLSIIEVQSLYINNFSPSFAKLFLLIEEAKIKYRNHLKKSIVFAPIFEEHPSKTIIERFNNIKSLAQYHNFEVIRTNDYANVLSEIETLSKKYGARLF